MKDAPIVTFVRNGRELTLGRTGTDTTIHMRGATGLGIAPVDIAKSDRLAGDGSIVRGVRFTDRDVFIPLFVRQPTMRDLHRWRHNLARLLAPVPGDPEASLVDVRVEDPTTGTVRTVRGIYKDGLSGDFGDDYHDHWQTIGLLLDCADPWWLGPERVRSLRPSAGVKPFLSDGEVVVERTNWSVDPRLRCAGSGDQAAPVTVREWDFTDSTQGWAAYGQTSAVRSEDGVLQWESASSASTVVVRSAPELWPIEAGRTVHVTARMRVVSGPQNPNGVYKRIEFGDTRVDLFENRTVAIGDWFDVEGTFTVPDNFTADQPCRLQLGVRDAGLVAVIQADDVHVWTDRNVVSVGGWPVEWPVGVEIVTGGGGLIVDTPGNPDVPDAPDGTPWTAHLAGGGTVTGTIGGSAPTWPTAGTIEKLMVGTGDYFDGDSEGARWSDAAYASTSIILAPGSAVPFFPVILAESVVLDEWTIRVDGDAEVWPTWEITGPGSDLLIESATTGERIFIAGDFRAETVTRISTRPARISPDRWDDVSLDSRLFPLQRGPNQLRVSMVGATTDTAVRLVWQERYLEAI